MAVLAFRLARHHLIGGYRDGPDLLAFPGVLADLVVGERGPRHQFAFPLTSRDGVRHEDQRGRLRLRHRGRAHERLARAAGQHDHARAAVEEPVDGLALVVAQRPALFAQLDRVRLAVDVPREVLRGPTDLEEGLLQMTALGRVHDDGVGVDTRAEHRSDPALPEYLLEYGPIQRDEHQAVDRRLGELQAAVAAHGVDDVDEQRLGDGVAGEADERVDDLLGVVPGGPRVPQRQRGDPVGVDVLGGAFELREGSDRRAGLRSGRMVDLEQQGLVGLDDQRPVGHSAFPSYGPSTGRAVEARSGGVGNPGPTRPDTSARTHRHTGGARGGERSIERATLLHRERTHAAPIIPGSPGHRPPRAGVSRPGVVPRRVGRPTDPSPREGPTVPPMTPTLPAHAPSFSAPVLPAPVAPGPTPRRPVIHREQSAPRLVAFANRRSNVSQCGRTSSAVAGYYKSWGTWA